MSASRFGNDEWQIERREMPRWQRRALGIFTLSGAVIGIAEVVRALASTTRAGDRFFCLLFMGIFAWGAWCGMRLLERSPNAEKAALKYWLIQIPAFSSPYLGFSLSGGFHFTVSIQFAPLAFAAKFLLGSSAYYSIMQPDKPWWIGINLFAVAVAWWIAENNSSDPKSKSGEFTPPVA